MASFEDCGDLCGMRLTGMMADYQMRICGYSLGRESEAE